MLNFKHSYISETEYNVIEDRNGYVRKVTNDYPDYVAWCAAGNAPEKVSGSKYITIVENVPTFDDALFLADQKEFKKVALRAKKHIKEFGGVTYDGKVFASDRESQFAVFRTKNGNKSAVNWKLKNGQYITLTISQLGDLNQAMFDHQQACFDREKEFVDLIDAATTVEAVAAIDINNF